MVRFAWKSDITKKVKIMVRESFAPEAHTPLIFRVLVAASQIPSDLRRARDRDGRIEREITASISEVDGNRKGTDGEA